MNRDRPLFRDAVELAEYIMPHCDPQDSFLLKKPSVTDFEWSAESASRTSRQADASRCDKAHPDSTACTIIDSLTAIHSRFGDENPWCDSQPRDRLKRTDNKEGAESSPSQSCESKKPVGKPRVAADSQRTEGAQQ